jgi:oxygen-independent coproporphyrinogen-3 oxidase
VGSDSLQSKIVLIYNRNVPRGLYVHIPFCETRCHYCNFVTTAEHSPDLRERFFKALSEEIKQVRKRYGQLAFDTLYLGGGTPSCLKASEIERLVTEIRPAFEFKQGYEFTCEFNPGDGDEAKFRVLREMGVNRISLGCQAFRDEMLQRIGRRHTVRDIAGTIAKIRKAEIQNISFDLMLRLPGQTLEDFRDSVRQCIALKASQVSLYDLEVHEGTPFGRLQKEGPPALRAVPDSTSRRTQGEGPGGKLDLPGEEIHGRMYESAIEMLTGAGYEHYEISNFAKPGLASRHNLIYWHNQEYLGLGPGAFSYLNGIRYQFAPDLACYLEKCEAGDWKNETEDRLSEEEKETETLVMGLRLPGGIAPEVFPKIHAVLKDRLETLCDEGLMERSGKNIRLTIRGKFLSEDVFGFLLEKPPCQNPAFPSSF